MYIDYSIYAVDGVEPEWVLEFKRVRNWLENALEYADNAFNIIDVADGLGSNNMQLWTEDNAAVVTQIVSYPRKKVLHVFLAGGEMDDVMKIEKSVVLWGKLQQCQAITFVGRPGWSKSLLKDIGYESVHISMTKEI